MKVYLVWYKYGERPPVLLAICESNETANEYIKNVLGKPPSIHEEAYIQEVNVIPSSSTSSPQCGSGIPGDWQEK